MSGWWTKLARLARDPRSLPLKLPRLCPVCGATGSRIRDPVILRELAADWALSDREWKQLDAREGEKCGHCHASLRSRQLAQVLIGELRHLAGVHARSLAEAVRARAAGELAIAEINSAGSLHPYLAALPGLAFSDYGSTDPAVPSQDLHALTYRDRRFDVVLTSDVLEHVPDVELALSESLRILRPGGAHLFTVPVVWGRPSRRRAELADGQIRHILPPSYHGDYRQRQDDLIVFHEFGDDFPDLVERIGFELEVVQDRRNPMLTVFVARRPRDP